MVKSLPLDLFFLLVIIMKVDVKRKNEIGHKAANGKSLISREDHYQYSTLCLTESTRIHTHARV